MVTYCCHGDPVVFVWRAFCLHRAGRCGEPFADVARFISQLTLFSLRFWM